ncbi:hypothetical protein MGWOODY_Mmi829 [hydrothermal vent metagenome]|uniref:Uncharacterized protein n=1 Tax=hydrothermal vent metagenome TaxID=652676 RepID=A0A160VFV0_9ZZZZ
MFKKNIHRLKQGRSLIWTGFLFFIVVWLMYYLNQLVRETG